MQISRIPKKVFLFVTNLTVVFVNLLLLPSKVKADAITDLQYRRAKMDTISNMLVKYGQIVKFGGKYKYKYRKSKIPLP